MPRRALGRATRASSISNESIGIVGVGGFATALASVIATERKAAVLFTDDADIRNEINFNHRNPARLPGVSLAKRVAATDDPSELCALCDIIIFSVPSNTIHKAAKDISLHLAEDHLIAHCAAGLLGAEQRVSTAILEVTGVRPIVALAGPALPRDLSARRSCALVAASHDDKSIERLRRSLHLPPVLRIYKSHDLAGVELSATIASALTVVMGVGDGFNIGEGPRTVLLTRAIAEGARIVGAAGADPKTFYGLAGLGNLLGRASASRGALSPDYQMGLAIGREQRYPYGSTEGSRSLEVIAAFSERLGVRANICTMVDRVVRGLMSPALASDLLGKIEIDLE